MDNKKIGNVNICLDFYTGTDEYSDGSVEDLLLETVKQYGDIDYMPFIHDNFSWPVLYHLSSIREGILDWYPFSPDDEVLEIGAGCGAVTGALLKNSCHVTSLDLSFKRSLINAYRHRDYDNLDIYVSNFEDYVGKFPKKYSCITLIGVLEYSALYINSAEPFVDMLKYAASMLNDDGTIIIAIENRLGLKYFAGCREDHLGMYFRGIEGYYPEDKIRTFSRKELLDIIFEAGMVCNRFYYPYPDYKFPKCIYSDEWLPKTGELNDNVRNFDADRLVVFDESRAFDSIISAGLFCELSNSFLVTLKKE